MIVYGAPVQTLNYDIYIDSNRENTELLLKIAEEFGFYPNMNDDLVLLKQIRDSEKDLEDIKYLTELKEGKIEKSNKFVILNG